MFFDFAAFDFLFVILLDKFNVHSFQFQIFISKRNQVQHHISSIHTISLKLSQQTDWD